MAVGAAIAAGRFSRDPASLLQRGGELLGDSSVLGQVGGLTKPLTAAGKAAAAGMVSRGIDSMGDRIKRRTDALRIDGEQAEPDDQDNSDEQEQDERVDRPERPAGRRPGRDGDADDEYDEAADDETADDYDEDEDEDEPEEEPRPSPRQAPRMRRRPPSDDSDDSDDSNGSQARRSERSDGGGAPVRRRVSKR